MKIPATESLVGDERITLVGLLFETAAALERQLGEDLRINADMTLGTFEILIRLARSPRARLQHNELAQQLSLTTGGITRSVDRLERAGLVYRERDPRDKRVYHVTLADEGRAALYAALPAHLAAIERLVVAPLPPDTPHALEQVIRPLRDTLISTSR